MPRTASLATLDVHPGELAKFLDECWKGWREGFPETDYILFSPAGKSSVYMIGLTEKAGYLDIDGQHYYSQAWL